jgi:hypothetical protein
MFPALVSTRKGGPCTLQGVVTKFDEPLFTDSRHGHHSVKFEERRRFVEWLATPPADRVPQSQNALADELGIHRKTLSKWKTDVRFVSEVSARVGRMIDLELMPSIVKSLHTQAQDPKNPRSVQAAKVLFDFARWNIERTEDNNSDVKDLTDEELRDLMLNTLDELDGRTHESAGSHH